MAILYSPKILPQHYDALRHVLHPDMPDTYDEWLYLETKQSADWLNRGHTVTQIEIDPDEFTRYCNAVRARGSLQNLRRFAAEKSGGKQY